MAILDNLYGYAKTQALYMTGRGLLSASLIAAAFISSVPGIVLLVSGSALLQGWMMWRRQCVKEDQMVNDYRDEIAARLGIDPTRVTAKDLHTVAYGDPSRGLEGNYIIAQSLERSGMRKLVGVLSTVASALLVMGGVLLIGSLFGSQVPELLEKAHKAISDVIPIQGNAKIFYLLMASGAGMSLVNNAVDYSVEWAFGINRRTAQSLIREIRRDVDMNKTISQEQVFGVFVAANPGLDRIIERTYGKPYYDLKTDQQTQALHQYGRSFQNPAVTHRTIEQLTNDINNRQIEADELVFAVVNQESGVPRLKEPQPIGKVKTEAQQTKQEIAMAVRGECKSAAEKSRDAARDRQEAEDLASDRIANDNQPDFADRFAPRHETTLQTREHKSHAAREENRRQQSHESLPEKVR